MKKANKVMIIDDEQTFIIPLEIGLKRMGIEVISFTDPEEAIKYLKNNKVDVLLTDYHMEPNINGDEVIHRIREFNKDIIIYLQTGYAEKLPADEMLEKYDIQGYIDKGEGQEKNFRLIKSALKHAQTLELVKEQEKQLDAQEYRNQFLGKFLNMLMGEIGEKSFSMAGNILSLEEIADEIPSNEREIYNKSVNNIKASIEKLNQLIKSLELERENITISELKDILISLFDVTFTVKDIKLNFKNNTGNEYLIISADVKVLVYILVDIIEYLIRSQEKEIDILCEKDDENIIIKVCNRIENDELFNKIEKLAMFDEKVIIKNEYNQIKVINKHT